MDKIYRSISSAAVRPLLAMSLLLSVVACKTCKKEEEKPTEESTENTTSSDEGSKTNKIPFAFTLTGPIEKNDVKFCGIKGKKVAVNAGDLVITIAGNTGNDDASKYSLQMTCTAYTGDDYITEDKGGKKIVLISPAIGKTLADLSGNPKLSAGTINVPFTFEAPANCTSRSVKVEVQLVGPSGNIAQSLEVRAKSNETPFAFTLTGPAEKSDIKFDGVKGKNLAVNVGDLVITIAGNTGNDDATKYSLQMECKAYKQDDYTKVDGGWKKIVLTSPAIGKTLADLLGNPKLSAGTINVPFTFEAPANCTSRSVKVKVQLVGPSGNIAQSLEVRAKSTDMPFAFTLTAPGEKADVNFHDQDKTVTIDEDLRITIVGNIGDDNATKYFLKTRYNAYENSDYTGDDKSTKKVNLTSFKPKVDLATLLKDEKLSAGTIDVPFRIMAPVKCTSRAILVTFQLEGPTGVIGTAEVKVKSGA